MLLLEIKDYIETKKTVSMSELVVHFGVSPEVLRDMLEHWIRKKQIVKVQHISEKCKKCEQCSPLLTEIYEIYITKEECI